MRELSTKKYKGLSKREAYLLRSLARMDKKIFSIEDAKSIIKNPNKILFNLSRKGWILRLKRGLYVLVPLEIGPKGADAYIIHDFLIVPHLVNPYYIGYWSALNYYGFTDQIPRTTFVATLNPKKPLRILSSEFYFVKISSNKFFGLKKIRVEGEQINISNKEKTIADCLDHPEHAGGIEEVAKAIYFNHKEIDLEKVERYLIKMDNLTAIKRFGYILDVCKIKYQIKTRRISKGYSLFDPLSPKKGIYNKKWMLIINKEINPEGWMY